MTEKEINDWVDNHLAFDIQENDPDYNVAHRIYVNVKAWASKIANKFYNIGYDQAEKDTIEKIHQQVEHWMPDNPEGDEYISGERVAFRSVLHFLKELEEQK